MGTLAFYSDMEYKICLEILEISASVAAMQFKSISEALWQSHRAEFSLEPQIDFE